MRTVNIEQYKTPNGILYVCWPMPKALKTFFQSIFLTYKDIKFLETKLGLSLTIINGTLLKPQKAEQILDLIKFKRVNLFKKRGCKKYNANDE